MAYTAQTNELAGNNPSVFARLGSWLTLFGRAVFVARGMEDRMEKIQDLQKMSDADLAKLGLKRDDITAYVFRDILYI